MSKLRKNQVEKKINLEKVKKQRKLSNKMVNLQQMIFRVMFRVMSVRDHKVKFLRKSFPILDFLYGIVSNFLQNVHPCLSPLFPGLKGLLIACICD